MLMLNYRSSVSLYILILEEFLSSDVAFSEKYFPENFEKFSGKFPKNRKNMFDS